MTANTPEYRADIDGLRGIAVLSVLIYHAKLGAPGGYVGVDVFFVISGYLITGWILKTVANGTFTFGEFWARRIRRILPASIAMNLTVLAMGYLLMFPKDFAELGESEIANNLFASNIYFWRTSGYFAGPAELKPLLHTWSLAIEEQFYLLFPPVLILLLNRSRRFAFGCLGFAMVLSLCACGYFTRSMPSASFYLLPTRTWELLAGSLLAFSSAPAFPHPLRRECVSALSLASILLCVFLFDHNITFPGFWAAIPVGCTALLIHANHGRATVASRLLSAKPLVFVGLISYSLYLWHWPVLAFAKYIFVTLDRSTLCASLVVNVVLATASWKWVESPIRRRVLAQGRMIFRPAFFAIAILLCVSIGVVLSHGARQRLSPAALTIIDGTEFKAQHLATDAVNFTAQNLPRLGATGTDPAFFVWGDSHALALAKMIDTNAKRQGLAGRIAAHGGIPPVLDVWYPNPASDNRNKLEAWNNQALKVVTECNFKHVILIAAWQNYIDQGTLADKTETRTSRETAIDALRNGLRKTVESLHTSGAQVWIFAQAPLQTFDVGRTFRNNAFYSWAPSPSPGIDQQAYESQTEDIRVILDSLESDRTHIIHPISEFFDSQGKGRLITQGNVLYVDSNHVTEFGARVFFDNVTAELLHRIKDENNGDSVSSER